MRDFKVVSYYTVNTLYEERQKILVESMRKLDIPYSVEGIKNLGSWRKNTNYKPTFLASCLKRFNCPIVWVDVDAEFKLYPSLFNELDCDIAVHEYYNKSKKIKETLSGTIYLGNTEGSKQIVNEWIEECRRHPHQWDQLSLRKVLKGRETPLPVEYCSIFDKIESSPVIVHYQCSRIVRQNKGRLDVGLK